MSGLDVHGESVEEREEFARRFWAWFRYYSARPTKLPRLRRSGHIRDVVPLAAYPPTR